MTDDMSDVKTFLKKLDALWTRAATDCPHCGEQVTAMEQIGRCVYSRPCGCRQGQGKLHEAWKK